MFKLFKKIEGRTAEEWFDLGYKEKDPKKKIEYFTKCLELNPKNKVAWEDKGYALRKLGRYEEAIRCYDRALEIDPRDAVAWYNKGIALDNLRRYEEAIRCYDKALEINPKYANAWNNKGVTLGKLGRYEEAIRCFDKAIEIDPEHEGAKNGKKIAGEKLREQKRKEETERKKALNAINEVHSLLQQAKNLGINTKWDEGKLNNAKLKLDGKDFSNATKLANECKISWSGR